MIDNVIVIDREHRKGLAEFVAERDLRDSLGRRPRSEGLEHYAVVLKWLALHAGPDGITKVALTTVARNVQHELGAPTFNAAHAFVKRALDTAKDEHGRYKGRLIQMGAVEVIEPLTERVRHHFRKEFTEWTGKLRVVDDLQAETVITRVRDR